MSIDKALKAGKLLLGYILIAVLIYLALQLKSCINDRNKLKPGINSNLPEISSSDTLTKYIYSTRWNTITFTPAAKEIIIHDSIEVPVFGPIDTLAVIKSFYRENIYIDTLKDSSLIAVLRIRVAQNRLVGHPVLTYKITVPQIEKTITNTVEDNKGFFLIGLRGGTDKTLYTTFGPEVIFVSKRKKAYGIGYDAIHKSLNASFFIPLER